MTNYVLVRTPSALINEGKIGIGWDKVNFSQFTDANALSAEIKRVYPTLKRSAKQVERFFNLKKGDIVVIPRYKSIYLAVVKGDKYFSPEYDEGHGANQIAVDCITQQDGKLLSIARSSLTEGLERRLRVRQTVAGLKEFASELDGIIANKDNLSLDDRYRQAVAQQQSVFQEELLNRLRHGKTRLDTGGDGLEKLIQELLLLEGYQNVQIPSKKGQPGVADVDLIAQEGDNKFLPTLLIQAKHHRGESGTHALKQLLAYEYEEKEGECVQRWMITTATVNDKTAQEAEAQGINIMTGDILVDWICQHLADLSHDTKLRLGICITPSLVTF